MMDLMPRTPLNPGAILVKSLALYTQTFVSCLPYVFLIVGVHFIIGVIPHLPFIPMTSQSSVVLMAASILLLPLIGGFFIYQQQLLQDKASLTSALTLGFKQLVPLVLSIIYLSFVPLILISLSVFSFLFLDPEKVSATIRIGLFATGMILTALFLANKILAPILVVSEQSDSMEAQNFCSKLTAGFYFRCLLLALTPIAIGVYLFWIPTLLNLFVTSNIEMAELVFQGMGDAVLGLVGPWMSMIVLLFINDLKIRKQAELKQENKQNSDQYEKAALKAKQPTDDDMI